MKSATKFRCVKTSSGKVVQQPISYDDEEDTAYFTVSWKTRKLVLSTAPKTGNNTDKDSKNRKRSH